MDYEAVVEDREYLTAPVVHRPGWAIAPSNLPYDPDVVGRFAIVVNSLPTDGLLQYFDGLFWVPVAVDQTVSRADIEAGFLVFGPDAHESGFDGYGPAGPGNLASDYARFSYQATDGVLLSAQAQMTVDVTPLADQPLLLLANAPDPSGAVGERFHTSWESAPNRNRNCTILPQSVLEGWQVVTESGTGGQEAFVIWSDGDRMKDADNKKQTVFSAPGNGQNFLEISNAEGLGHQTYGIERTGETRTGATYRLDFDYAGRLGYAADHTKIGFYVDGVLIGTYANTSPNTSLNWQSVNFEFTGNGSTQTIRLVTEATQSVSNGRGALIDDIAFTEVLPLNTGYENAPIRLSAILASLADMDGSETLTVSVGALPVDAVLTDGTETFTATAGGTVADVTTWDWDNLSITAPTDFTGTFDLEVTATATEAVTGDTASHTVPLTVTVLPDPTQSPIVLDLDGDGIRTTSLDESRGTFDLMGMGTAVHSGWISTGDGFLAIDTNGNGEIDGLSELFGGAIGDGFAKLSSFDTNYDGRVDADDERFHELKVWQDLDGDHRTDAGELASLTDHGVISLSTRYTIRSEEQAGNWLVERGTATYGDGRSIEMADVYFALDPSAAGRVEVESDEPGEPEARQRVGVVSEARTARIVVQSLARGQDARDRGDAWTRFDSAWERLISGGSLESEGDEDADWALLPKHRHGDYIPAHAERDEAKRRRMLGELEGADETEEPTEVTLPAAPGVSRAAEAGSADRLRIDWYAALHASAAATSSRYSLETPSDASWLGEFLGAEPENDDDIGALTGLRITLPRR